MKKRIRQANRKFSLGQTENELGQNMYQFFLDETYNDCTAKTAISKKGKIPQKKQKIKGFELFQTKSDVIP